jgi:hypothetical protein
MATDPDYQTNQRDCQRAWQKSHPDYWRQYRSQWANTRERNRLLQQHRDTKRRLRVLAKMDASELGCPNQPISLDRFLDSSYWLETQ